MEATAAARQVLSSCPPLAPMCEQYLDFGSLGSSVARHDLADEIEEIYSDRDIATYSRTYKEVALDLVESLDDVTVNLMLTSLKLHLLTPSMVFKTLTMFDNPLLIRHYLLMKIAVDDLEAKSGLSRQFYGLHELDASGHLVPLNLGTDEEFQRAIALMRYAVAVSNGLPINMELAVFGTRNDDALIINSEIRQLILERPEDVDQIAAIVIARESQDVVVIKAILDDGVPVPLGSGAL